MYTYIYIYTYGGVFFQRGMKPGFPGPRFHTGFIPGFIPRFHTPVSYLDFIAGFHTLTSYLATMSRMRTLYKSVLAACYLDRYLQQCPSTYDLQCKRAVTWTDICNSGT